MTPYFFDAPPVRSGFFRRLTGFPTAGYAVAGVLGLVLICAASVFGIGIVANAALAGVSKATPLLGNALTLLLSFGPLWVFALIVFGVSGFRGTGLTARQLGSRILIGLALGLLVAGVCAVLQVVLSGQPLSAFVFPADGGFWLAGLGMFAIYTVQGGGEELIFRSLLARFLGRRLGTIPVLAITTLTFAAMHIVPALKNPLAFVSTAAAGLLIALLAIHGRSLWIAIAFHGMFNWFNAYVLPTLLGSSGYKPNLTLIHSLSTGVALIASIVLIVLLNAQRPGWHRRPVREAPLRTEQTVAA